MNAKTYEYDPSKHAGTTITELYGILHTAIERYRHSFCETLGDTPARRAREQEAEYPPRMPASVAEFNAEWSSSATRTIGRLGIEFEGRYYYRAELEKLKNAAGDAKRKRFAIRILPEDIRSIYVRDHDGALLEVPCTESSDEALPLEVHRLHRKLRKTRGTAEDERTVDGADERIDATAEKGRKRAAARQTAKARAEEKMRKAKAAAAASGAGAGAKNSSENTDALDKVLAEMAQRDASSSTRPGPNTDGSERSKGART